MKNKFIIICVILAAIMSLMSFTAVLTRLDKADDTDAAIETTEPTPTVKTAVIYSEANGPQGTIIYIEGMTWEEWVNSELNTYPHDFSVYENSVSFRGVEIFGASGVNADAPLDNLGIVYGNDVIEHPYYFFD